MQLFNKIQKRKLPLSDRKERKAQAWKIKFDDLTRMAQHRHQWRPMTADLPRGDGTDDESQRTFVIW